MPSNEAGFYQLTALLPIKAGAYSSLLGENNASNAFESTRSYVHHLKAYLNKLSDSYLQEIDDNPSGPSIPHLFDHTSRTHFARFVVIDQLFYNGRRRNDSLVDFVRLMLNKDVLSRKDRIDQLHTSYLLVAIDFDCSHGSTTCVQDYLSELWPYAQDELTEIFWHCEGFALPSPFNDQFCQTYANDWYLYQVVERLILSHEVETTYPFSAYFWAAENVRRWNPLTDQVSPSRFRNRWGLILVGTLPLILISLALLILPFYMGSFFFNLLYQAAFPDIDLSNFYSAWNQWGLIGFCLSIASLILFMFAWRYFVSSANQSLDPINGVDLKSILKSLYIQSELFNMYKIWQEHDRFDRSSLRKRFARFLDKTKPSDIHAPSLKPGKYFSTFPE